MQVLLRTSQNPLKTAFLSGGFFNSAVGEREAPISIKYSVCTSVPKNSKWAPANFFFPLQIGKLRSFFSHPRLKFSCRLRSFLFSSSTVDALAQEGQRFKWMLCSLSCLKYLYNLILYIYRNVQFSLILCTSHLKSCLCLFSMSFS